MARFLYNPKTPNPPNPMKVKAWLLPALFAFGVPLIGYAQSTGPRGFLADQVDEEETVSLSPFEVSSERVTGYTVTDSAASRIRRELINTPISIQVITSEFIDDIGAASLFDATRYLSGISASTGSGMTGAGDRLTIRGFGIAGVTVDNFGAGANDSSFDPAVVDRAEVIKGPHGILAPSGPPGGVWNILTKSPKFGDPEYMIKAEMSDQYFANKGTIDATGRIPGTENLAYRMIGTYRDARSYDPGHISNKSINPMLTWAITEKTQFKFKGFFNNWEHRGAGANMYLADDFPIDGTVSSSPKDYRPGYVPFGGNGAPLWAYRDEKVRRAMAELTTALGNHLNLRLAGYKHYVHYQSLGGGLRIFRDDLGNRVNPMTGKWTETLRWDLQDPTQPWHEQSNPYVSTPVDPLAPATITDVWLTEGQAHYWVEEAHYQADLAGKFDFGGYPDEPLVTLNILTGVARSKQKNRFRNWDVPGENITDAYDPSLPFLDNPTRPSSVAWIRRGFDEPREGGNHGELIGWIDTQYYINTQIDTFKGRVIWSGGVSYHKVENKYMDHFRGALRDDWEHTKSVPSYAVLFKARSNISIYAAHAVNSGRGEWFAGQDLGTLSTSQDGKQEELGLKFDFFDRRLSVTTSYFEIKKGNQPQQDSRNAELPVGADPIYPDILLDITNEGFEVDISGQLTTNLSILGSFTQQKMRDPLGRRQANVPDTMFNGLVMYKFSQERLKNLKLHLGFTHSEGSPGENRSSAPTALGAIETASFYLPAQTVYNAGASYTLGAISFQLNIDNLTDVMKPERSGGRSSIAMTPPRNIRLTTTFKF